MSLKPLSRDHSLAILHPNPMWVPTHYELTLLYLSLPPCPSIAFYRIFSLEKDRESAIETISSFPQRVIQQQRENTPLKKIIISFSRETTVDSKSFIDINGKHHTVTGDRKPFRQYFDGYAFPKKSNLGHATSACIDLEKKTIETQDPQGIPTKPWISEALKHAFPDFSYVDLQLKQQNDAHSCALLNYLNLTRFAQGLSLDRNVDLTQLRTQCLEQLEGEESETKHSEAVHHSSARNGLYYSGQPVYLIRYTPI